MATITRVPELYDGFDSFTGQALGESAVSGSSSTGLNGSSSNTVSICTDTDSVTSAISVSGSVSDANASAKATWVQSLSVTSTSVVVVVHTVVQSITQADHYGLVPGSAPSSDDQIQSFFKSYGDSWVSELLVGAEYYAAFVYDSTSVEQQQSITSKLSASAGNLSASLSATLNNTASDTQTTMRINQQMLGPTTLAYPSADADSIVTFALDFTANVGGQYTVLAYGVTGYEDVGVSDFGAVVKNRNLLGTASPLPFVDTLAALNNLQSQMDLIQDMYTAYGYTGDTEFTKRAGDVGDDVHTLTNLINDIEQNVTGANPPPTLKTLGYGTPLVTYTTALNPPLPSSEGFIGVTNDLDASQIAKGRKPVSIIVLSSGFQVTYSDNTVVVHGDGDEAGGLSIETNDLITLVGFKEGNSYQIGEIQTAKQKSYGSSGSWTYAKAPPTIIGFGQGGIYPFDVAEGKPMLVAAAALTITLLPAVWVQSTSS